MRSLYVSCLSHARKCRRPNELSAPAAVRLRHCTETSLAMSQAMSQGPVHRSVHTLDMKNEPCGPARLAQGRPAAQGFTRSHALLPIGKRVRRARCSPVNRIAMEPPPTGAAALFTEQLRMSPALVGWAGQRCLAPAERLCRRSRLWPAMGGAALLRIVASATMAPVSASSAATLSAWWKPCR